jgi:hypothetical protein
LVAEICGPTLRRWLNSDALRPWQHRSWIFPRDPNFAQKAGPILDLYQRVWDGAPLGPDDYVISADEKTSIQARRRKQPTLPPAPRRSTRVESEYFREGAWVYLAAWDVHRAKVFGRCESQNGIAPVRRLASEVMGQEPLRLPAASSGSWTTAPLIGVRRLPTASGPSVLTRSSSIPLSNASWLNQVEIFFSIVQRKVLTPNDFCSLAELEQRLMAFQFHYERTARPLKWTFIRKDLHALLTRINAKRLAPAA